MLDLFSEYKLELTSFGLMAITAAYFMRLRRVKNTWRVIDTIKTSMEGKTVVITGANTGIGYETALELARRGARVVLACRDRTRALRAVERIKAATSGNAQVVAESLDLASLDSVKQFADTIKHTYSSLDVLINNAGKRRSFYLRLWILQ